jgi:hypothetical protein
LLLLTYNDKTDLEEDEEIKAGGGEIKGEGEASKGEDVAVDVEETSNRWFLLYVHRDLLEDTALLDCVFFCVFVCGCAVSTVQPMCACVRERVSVCERETDRRET